MNGAPDLPPSPLASELPALPVEVRLPWSTLAYAAALGAATAPLGRFATYAAVVHSGALRLLPTPPPSTPNPVDLAGEALSGAVGAGAACLALVAADRVAVSAPRWLRWVVALAMVGLLPLLVFVPGALRSPQPARYLMMFLPGAVSTLCAMGGGGALMALAARAGSGLFWKLPLIALAMAFLAPAAGALMTALTISPRAASVGLSATSLAVDWLAFAPSLAAIALAAALGLQSAQRAQARQRSRRGRWTR